MPVCSPALAADRARPIRRPEDLARHVLLHIDDTGGRYTWLNWSVWLAAVGVRDLAPAGSLRFTHFDQVIQAAVDGQGVALGRVPLIDSLLKQRKLVAPLRGKVHDGARVFRRSRHAGRHCGPRRSSSSTG